RQIVLRRSHCALPSPKSSRFEHGTSRGTRLRFASCEVPFPFSQTASVTSKQTGKIKKGPPRGAFWLVTSVETLLELHLGLIYEDCCPALREFKASFSKPITTAALIKTYRIQLVGLSL